MVVKYRLGLTISAETLFALLGRVLPIEDLAVEELAPTPMQAMPKAAQQPAQLAKPKLTKRRGTRTSESYKQINLKAGVNGILMDILSDGQLHPTGEFKPAMRSRGFADAGTSSALAKLLKRGIVFQPEFGMWQLTKEYRQKESA
jgi:hypothetical protein